MLNLKNDTASHGDVIVCSFQNLGKGQGASKWFSSPGCNLLLSVICKDIQLFISHQTSLNLSVSLALHDLISHYFPDRTWIKWPNDLMVDGKKVAGILIETQLQSEKIKNCVIGIGLNVNEDKFPPSLQHAISMLQVSGHFFNLDTLLSTFLSNLNYRLGQWIHSEFEAIKSQYESRLYGMQSKRIFQTVKGPIEGEIIGINEMGQLMVESNREILIFNHKEISFELH